MTPTKAVLAVWLALGLVGLALVAIVARGCAPGTATGPTVVTDTVVLAGRPITGPVRWRDRIVRVRVKGETRVTEAAPDTAVARKYAQAVQAAEAYRDSLKAMKARGDTSTPPKAPRAILPPITGTYDGDSLRLWAARSDGQVMRAAARLRPHFSFAMGYDVESERAPVFMEDRAWLRTVRQAKKCAAPTGVMAGVGALVHQQDRVEGAVIAGLATLVGCLAG